jgi:dUTP pyrophosphatase
MKVKIVNKSRHGLPAYTTPLSAGMDLYASLNEAVILQPLERQLIGTGIFIELPEGYEAQVRPRSGLAVKRGLSVLNTPGTIDADYRGEIKVIMVNLSNEPCEILDGERIAQLVVSRHEKVEWIETVQLTGSDRGTGGFGHTGV